MNTSSLDHFAVLGEQRRPWLEPEMLKERFHRLTAEHHPDVNPESDFPSIIAAYNALSDPKTRLRHLLELEFPANLAADTRSIPADLQDLFMKIAGAQAGFGRVAKQLETANSPLARALIAEEKSSVSGQMKALLESLQEKEATELQALKALDLRWPQEKESLASDLAAIHQRLSFLQKWSGQLRESALFLEM